LAIGGHKQADQANAGATQAAGTSQGTATGFGGQQQGLFETLFGMPNKGGPGLGTGGTLRPFMDPNSLNVNAPTGPYALQYQQAKAQGATDTDFAKQAIEREAGNKGFGAGAPSGYTGFLKSQADLTNAGNTGQLFSQFAGKSYQDALSNFWKANQAAGTAMGEAGNQQNTAQGQTNQTYTNLYSSAPKSNPYVTSGIEAAGTAAGGALSCLCEDTMLTMADGTLVNIKDLKHGMMLAAQNGKKNRVREVMKYDDVPTVKIETINGLILSASRTHTLVLPLGGYTRVEDSLMQTVSTAKGPSIVKAMADLGKQTVYQIFLDASHDYCSNGYWSLE
jgi:hypothetical protein